MPVVTLNVVLILGLKVLRTRLALSHAVVTAAGDIEDGLPQTEEHREDVIQFYGFKVSTDKGVLVIDYRNESNGYYGGSLTWPGDYHYGGVFEQNISNGDFQDI